jgi:hypothetical protein
MSGFRRMMMANAAFNPLKVPLTFTAEENGATIKFTGLSIDTLRYRMGSGWERYVIGTEISVPVGQSIQFWNENNTLSIDTTSNYGMFTIPKRMKCSGNIQSLINFSENCPDFCFCRLFKNCAITTAPDLPAKRVGVSSYFGLFATTSALAGEVVIQAEKLQYQACYYMFTGTSSGKLFVDIRATDLDMSACVGMFDNAVVAGIKVRFTEWRNTNDWVTGILSTGTFYKPSALPEEYGGGRIPTGWTVVNID